METFFLLFLFWKDIFMVLQKQNEEQRVNFSQQMFAVVWCHLDVRTATRLSDLKIACIWSQIPRTKVWVDSVESSWWVALAFPILYPLWCETYCNRIQGIHSWVSLINLEQWPTTFLKKWEKGWTKAQAITPFCGYYPFSSCWLGWTWISLESFPMTHWGL